MMTTRRIETKDRRDGLKGMLFTIRGEFVLDSFQHLSLLAFVPYIPELTVSNIAIVIYLSNGQRLNSS